MDEGAGVGLGDPSGEGVGVASDPPGATRFSTNVPSPYPAAAATATITRPVRTTEERVWFMKAFHHTKQPLTEARTEPYVFSTRRLRVLNMLTDRQSVILCSTVQEHIRRGTPVGSELLLERRRLPWSSATVRAEFASLEHQGFLVHPHRSSGRIPTRLGYRYYVDHAVEAEPFPAAMAALRRVEPVVEEQREAVLVRELAHIIAELSGTLAVVAMPKVFVHEAGLSNLFRMPEFAESETADDIERVLDGVEEHGETLLARLTNGEPAVFINGENPVAPAERVSVVVTAPTLPNGAPLLAVLIGPLRMSYAKHMSILRAVHALQSP